MDGGSEKWLVAGGRRWWRQNYAWLWLVLSGGGEIMASSGWSWIVVAGRTFCNVLLIADKAKTTAPSLKNLPDKLSIPAAFYGLLSFSNFKTSSSGLGEKVNYRFSVFRNLL